MTEVMVDWLDLSSLQRSNKLLFFPPFAQSAVSAPIDFNRDSLPLSFGLLVIHFAFDLLPRYIYTHFLHFYPCILIQTKFYKGIETLIIKKNKKILLFESQIRKHATLKVFIKTSHFICHIRLFCIAVRNRMKIIILAFVIEEHLYRMV